MTRRDDNAHIRRLLDHRQRYHRRAHKTVGQHHTKARRPENLRHPTGKHLAAKATVIPDHRHLVTPRQHPASRRLRYPTQILNRIVLRNDRPPPIGAKAYVLCHASVFY